MGCHTWYSVPVKTDKDEIINLAQQFIDDQDNKGFITEDHKKMYQYAIDNQLCNVVTELASFQADLKSGQDPDEWILYQDEHKFVVDEYNKTTDLGEDVGYYDYDEQARRNIEWCGSEPRIGGYPDKVIRSYDEMIKFMEEGYHGTTGHGDDAKPHHYTFRLEDDRRERVMNNIKRFFETYPKGIITFG